MYTDKHRLIFEEAWMKVRPCKVWVFLFVFICVHLWFQAPAFAAPTPVSDKAFEAAAKGLDQAKSEVQKMKDVWDKARMETTLYDQRAKRAYQKWAKAKKDLKKKAEEQKERAQLELQLAIEKRKLAYNQWQAAQYRVLSHESQLKALDQDKDTRAVQERIKKMEEKLGRPKSGGQPSAVSGQP